MKFEACQSYRELIERYSCNELNAEDTEKLLQHTQQCQDCRQYLNDLSDQDEKMTGWAQSLNPIIEEGQTRAIEQFRLMKTQPVPATGSRFNRWIWFRYATAACILIVAGFLAGRGMGPSLEIDQQQLEQRITASVLNSLSADITAEYAGMQDVLSDQINTELKSYAEQIAAHNDAQVYQLLTGLIEAIKTAQVENQQWALSAMAELEDQRLRDQKEVNTQVAALAMYTGKELLRTQQAIDALQIQKNNNQIK